MYLTRPVFRREFLQREGQRSWEIRVHQTALVLSKVGGVTNGLLGRAVQQLSVPFHTFAHSRRVATFIIASG